MKPQGLLFFHKAHRNPVKLIRDLALFTLPSRPILLIHSNAEFLDILESEDDQLLIDKREIKSRENIASGTFPIYFALMVIVFAVLFTNARPNLQYWKEGKSPPVEDMNHYEFSATKTQIDQWDKLDS